MHDFVLKTHFTLNGLMGEKNRRIYRKERKKVANLSLIDCLVLNILWSSVSSWVLDQDCVNSNED